MVKYTFYYSNGKVTNIDSISKHNNSDFEFAPTSKINNKNPPSIFLSFFFLKIMYIWVSMHTWVQMLPRTGEAGTGGILGPVRPV